MDTALHTKLVETGDFSGEIRSIVRPIKDSQDIFSVYRLTYECYLTRGHFLPRGDGLWIPHPDFDHIPETQILVAELDGQIVGSVSTTLDGARGLPMEQEFHRICMLSRTDEHRIAEVWRLLVKDDCPIIDTVLTDLVKQATSRLIENGIQSGLYFIQEPDAPFCRNLINAKTLLRMRSARGLSNACSVLMRAEINANVSNVISSYENNRANGHPPSRWPA